MPKLPKKKGVKYLEVTYKGVDKTWKSKLQSL